ncbi:MAG: hypothetical protein LBS66_00495 [Rhodospirillaceae bacterium]|jgi:hypothetical protein|nr:hypothetical protein [Rhodospirillaceae bacterium]
MHHIIVNTLVETNSALQGAGEIKCPITLYSPPWAVHSIGIGYFLTMISLARQQQIPMTKSLAVLDCGEAVGFALAAIKSGVEAIIITGNPSVINKLSDIATQCNVRLFNRMPEKVLDLRNYSDPLTAVRSFLSL